MMECPNCYGKTTVYFTREEIDGVRRKRKCLECGYRFETMETRLPVRRENIGANDAVSQNGKKVCENG